ncbi:MAG: hypothetical protein OEZ28_03865, partial [Nitrospinota bacterium]|nr:hypothetical protein [Nitrospinota bacterium]
MQMTQKNSNIQTALTINILNHSLYCVNRELKENHKYEDISNLNICFGRTTVNTRYEKHFLSYSGFLNFKIENLATGFDEKYGYNQEIKEGIKRILGNNLVLQNLSTGICLLDDEELKNRQKNGSGMKKGDIIGYLTLLLEADCDLEMQYKFWTVTFPKLTGLPIPILIFSGGRSYHVLFIFNKMISVEEHEQLQLLASQIEFWEYGKISDELKELFDEQTTIKKSKIERIKNEFLKSFEDLADDLKDKIHGNNKKVEFEKKKDLIKGKLIKDVRKEFAKSIVSGEEKI